jgi:hypothetical protein
MASTTSPPRRRRRPTVFPAGSAEPLCHELELSLLLGRGVSGTPPAALQHVDDWRRVWGEYRHVIEPKAREYLPGRRPFARYLLGELPPPPLLRDPPLSRRYFRLWVPGTGRFWTQYPEPWQRNETSWLVEIGEVGQAEYQRWRERIRNRSRADVGRGVFALLGDYELERGRYL